jgi:NDP-sugar pyrophosphorylase family protein
MDTIMLQNALNILKNNLIIKEAHPEISSQELGVFAINTVVVLTAGGEGSRLRSMTEIDKAHKAALRLPTGDTMIERTIKMYRDAGFRRFVILVFHRASSIQDLLKDGDQLGVSIKYSEDPGRPVGRGGAIRNAIENGIILENESFIVHNPDDQLVNYQGSFVHDIVGAHLKGVEKNMVGTAVLTDGTPYPFTGMMVNKGVIESIETNPFIPIPTHIGVTIFGTEAHHYFIEYCDLSKKTDFENVLFPLLSEQRKLYSFFIPHNNWISVNDPKGYTSLVKALEAIHDEE